MKKPLIIVAAAAMLLGVAPMGRAQVTFDLHIGPPPAPRAYRVPPPPAPDYEWIEGYWYPQGSHYRWHDGYWTRPPYPGAYWVAPYYLRGEYFAGRWEGPRGNVGHDHRWDRSRERDEHHNGKDHR